MQSSDVKVPMPVTQSTFSRVGLAFVLMYAAAIAACLVMALNADGDPKGRFVFLQLPIAIQGDIVYALGFGEYLSGMSWVTAYLVLAAPTFALLYLLGRLLEGGRSNTSIERGSAKSSAPLN